LAGIEGKTSHFPKTMENHRKKACLGGSAAILAIVAQRRRAETDESNACGPEPGSFKGTSMRHITVSLRS
jgi:hypothetical protein